MSRSRWRGFLAACAAVLIARAAYACSCVEYLSEPAEALSKSSLVFAGEVTAVDVVSLPTIVYVNNEPEPHEYMERKALVTLKVIKEWKGSGSSEYVVLAGAPPVTPLSKNEVMVDCEEHLYLGQKYLVFVEQYGYAEVSSCALTGQLDQSQKVVAALDRVAAQQTRRKPK